MQIVSYGHSDFNSSHCNLLLLFTGQYLLTSVYNSKESTVYRLSQLVFSKPSNQSEVLKETRQYIESDGLFSRKYNRCNFSSVSGMSTLVSEKILEQSSVKELLNLNFGDLSNQIISEHKIDDLSCLSIHPQGISDLVSQYFQPVTYVSPFQLLCEAARSRLKETAECMAVMQLDSSLFIAAWRNDKYLFYNQFEAHNEEDVMYFILLATEQLNLNRSYLELYFANHNEQNLKLMQDLRKYIRKVSTPTIEAIKPADISLEVADPGIFLPMYLLSLCA